MRKGSPLLPIFLIVAVDILGLTLILPLLPFYAEHYGATPKVVGLLVATYAACALIAGPILGQISDRAGRKPVLALSQVGTLIGFLMLAFAQSLGMIFLARIVDGLTAGNLSLAQAYISDVTEPKDRAKSFAVIGIAFGLGFLIGPAISGYLSQFGYQYPIYAAAFLSFCSILCTSFLLPSASTVHRSPEAEAQGPEAPGGKRLTLFSWGAYAQFFARPVLGELLVQFFLFTFSFALFTSGFALFAERRYTWNGAPFGPKQVGYVFAYAGFLGIILQGGLIGRLVKRYGERKLAVSGFFGQLLGFGALGLTRNVPELLSASTVSSYGNGVLRPTLTSLVTQNAGRHEQGVVLGLTQSLMSVSQIIAPVVAGLLIEHDLLTQWAWVAGATSGIAMLLAARSHARAVPQEHQPRTA